MISVTALSFRSTCLDFWFDAFLLATSFLLVKKGGFHADPLQYVHQIISLLVLLLIPIIILYALSNQVSVNVLIGEIRELNQKDMQFLANEVNSSVENLSTMAFLLTEDIHIQQLQHIHLMENAYERNEQKFRILERLRLLNVAERWDTQYTVMAPQIGEVVSTNYQVSFDMDELKRVMTPVWEYKQMNVAGRSEWRFVRHILKLGSSIREPEKAGLIVEVSFPQEYLVKELDNFKRAGKGDPFLYHPVSGVIVNKTADTGKLDQLARQIDPARVSALDGQFVKLDGKEYMVLMAHIPALGWYLVDCVPLEEMLEPIVQSRNLFYGSVGLLLVLSTLAAYLLYRNVQKPIRTLIRSVQRLRVGDYSVRITGNPRNEFTFLFQRFNEMASEIEELINRVYVEQIRARDANLKQLQSQINPHFLYNCFALIRSLTRLGKKESVMDLAMHLSKYYRYTTRTEKVTASLREELRLIESYLEIQKLHIQHLSYEINVPESMMEHEVPRLLLQPIVENAVMHGIERSEADGLVRVSGEERESACVIVVEDNGLGMSDRQLEKLRRDIRMPPDDDTGCALWNIRQRLLLQFGEEATLAFARRPGGGTIVKIEWPLPAS